jgi:site-specific DNA-cytosine methylase
MGKGPRGTEAIESNHIMPVFPTLDASMDAKFGSNQWVDSGQWVFHPTQTPISNKDICHAIGANSNATAAVAFAQNSRDELRESPVVGALSTGGGKPGQGYHAVRENMKVRRLTPRECERLQGFPDDFTKIPYRNKTLSECPDGPRYKALGNSMAVPVMKWIGERIEKVARLAG